MKLESQPQSRAHILSAINKSLWKEKPYGKYSMIKLFSIIMQYADDGDLYQKILEHKKKKQLFEEN